MDKATANAIAISNIVTLAESYQKICNEIINRESNKMYIERMSELDQSFAKAIKGEAMNLIVE